MILEKISHSLNPDIFFHLINKYLNDFGLVFGIEDLGLALEENTNAIKRQDFQGLGADDSVEHEEELFDVDVANKRVENPWEDQAQGLDVQLLKFIDQLFLCGVEQLFKQHTQSCINTKLPRIPSFADDITCKLTK